MSEVGRSAGRWRAAGDAGRAGRPGSHGRGRSGPLCSIEGVGGGCSYAGKLLWRAWLWRACMCVRWMSRGLRSDGGVQVGHDRRATRRAVLDDCLLRWACLGRVVVCQCASSCVSSRCRLQTHAATELTQCRTGATLADRPPGQARPWGPRPLARHSSAARPHWLDGSLAMAARLWLHLHKPLSQHHRARSGCLAAVCCLLSCLSSRPR